MDLTPPMALAPTTTAGVSRAAALAHHGTLLFLGVATVVAAVSGKSGLALAAAPVLLFSLAFLLAKLPLQSSATALIVLMLVPDTNDGYGQWRTPMAIVGDVVSRGLDRVLGIPSLAASGTEILLLFLIGVSIARRAPRGSEVSGETGAPASALGPFLALYVAGVLLAEAIGLVRGLPVAAWKLRILLQPLLLAVLFLAAFRSTRDHLMIGRVVVGAAAIRAAMAWVIQRMAVALTGGKYAYATSHGDSILFSVGLFLVLADFALRPTRRRLLRNGLLAALILEGAIQNDRRAFWVMAGLTVLLAYLVSPRDRWKRTLVRYLAVALPVAGLYVAAGWSSGSPLFGPVQTLRGMVDTSQSRSSYWREVENWNIAMSMRDTALTGTGLGGEYTEIMENDDISDAYPEYREWPHNQVLGLLLLAGPFGFTAVLALLGLVFFLARRSFRVATTPEHRLAAFGCMAAVVACLVMAWTDLGLGFPQYKALAALAIAVSARLAVVTGAWPSGSREAA